MSELILEEDVSIGAPIAVRNLCIFPLSGRPGADTRTYLTLDEALAQQLVETTETSAGGSVPELLFVNRAELPVLLLDGEELAGAKQNRVLNITVLAPARARTVIPVSCIEAGRWAYKSRAFRTTGRAQHAKGRAMKMDAVTRSLKMTGNPRSDQGAVWNEIDRKMAAMGYASPTRALSDLFDVRQPDIEDIVGRVTLPADVTGAAFAVNGKMLGLEMFDCAAVAGKLLPKIIRSWALDALERAPADAATVEPADAGALLDNIAAARPERFATVGEGQHLRFETDAVIGGALSWKGAPVHTLAFARDLTI